MHNDNHTAQQWLQAGVITAGKCTRGSGKKHGIHLRALSQSLGPSNRAMLIQHKTINTSCQTATQFSTLPSAWHTTTGL